MPKNIKTTKNLKNVLVRLLVLRYREVEERGYLCSEQNSSNDISFRRDKKGAESVGPKCSRCLKASNGFDEDKETSRTGRCVVISSDKISISILRFIEKEQIWVVLIFESANHSSGNRASDAEFYWKGIGYVGEPIATALSPYEENEHFFMSDVFNNTEDE